MQEDSGTVKLMQEDYSKRGVELNASRLRMARLPTPSEVRLLPISLIIRRHELTLGFLYDCCISFPPYLAEPKSHPTHPVLGSYLREWEGTESSLPTF